MISLLKRSVLLPGLASLFLIAAAGGEPSVEKETDPARHAGNAVEDDAYGTGDILGADGDKNEASAPEDRIEEGGGHDLRLKATLKNLYTFHRTDSYTGSVPVTPSSKNLSADLTRLRLSPEYRYGSSFQFRMDLDSELIASNYGRSLDFTSAWRPVQYNDLFHAETDVVRGKNVFCRVKVPRAYAKLHFGKFAATIGRQQVRFGSGKLWNPLDILNPVSPTFVEGPDEQKGTDAARLDWFTNDKTEMTLVVDLKRTNDRLEDFTPANCNYIARVKTSVKDADLAVLAGYVSRRAVAGFDFAAIVFDGMLRGSATGMKSPGERMFFQANAGYEYSFKKGISILAEYYYNQRAVNYDTDLRGAAYAFQNWGMGTVRPRDVALQLAGSDPVFSLARAAREISRSRGLHEPVPFGIKSLKGTAGSYRYWGRGQATYQALANQSLTLNRHFIGFGAGYDFHPLVRGDLFLIADVQGRGAYFGPSVRVNVLENLELVLGFMGAAVQGGRVSDFSDLSRNYMFYASGRFVF